MRGQTLSINDGNNSKLSFSDGTLQTTAYTGTSSGDLVVNNLTVQDNLIVDGNETINGTLLVDETLNVLGNTTIDGTLTVQENTSCAGELDILNNLTVYGNTILGSNSSTSSTTIYGKVIQNLPNSCTSYGNSALNNLQTGAGNSCIGVNSGYYTSTGYNNSSLGCYSMQGNQTGNNNVCIGFESMVSGTSASNNTCVGANSMPANETGNNNVCVGFESMLTNNTGSNNTCVGVYSMQGNETGSYNTCIGYGAGFSDTGNTNTNIGYNSTSGNYSYSTSIGQSSTNTADHQIMLGTTSETVVIPNTVSIGNNYNAQDIVNILGGLNVNYVATGVSANNNIFGSTNTILGANENIFQATTNYLNSAQTNIEGNCNIGTGSTTAVCNIEANSIVGSSSSNTSTFNAIPNFVNGFQCGSGNARKLYMGTASWTGYYTTNYSVSNGNELSPVVNSGGTSYGSYALDQSIPNIVGCFINPFVNSTNSNGTVYPFVSTWYFNQISETEINVVWANLGTNYEQIPTSVQYIAFV